MVATEDSPSEALLAAVAEREGVAEADLETPLFDAINPEALDELFNDSSGHVTFEYAGYLVTIDDEQAVDLEPLDEAEH
jgi:hypothetical protein